MDSYTKDLLARTVEECSAKGLDLCIGPDGVYGGVEWHAVAISQHDDRIGWTMGDLAGALAALLHDLGHDPCANVVSRREGKR